MRLIYLISAKGSRSFGSKNDTLLYSYDGERAFLKMNEAILNKEYFVLQRLLSHPDYLKTLKNGHECIWVV